MADPRQLPLFSSQPQSEDDLNRYTQIRHALPLFREYLKKEGKTENTINAFMGDLNLFIEYQGGEMSVSRFQTRHLNEFLHWMENERGVSCSRKTYARRVTSLKVFFKWLTTIEAVRHDPAEKVLQRSGEAPLSYALNPDEIERMATFAATMERHGKPDTRPAMLFHLLLDTGIKKSEAKRLTVEDIHREDVHKPFLHVHHTSRNVYKERKIHLSPEWFPLYDEYCQQYEIEDAVFTCTPRNLEYILADMSKGAGIPTKVSFEIMRWTSAVRDKRNGLDDQLIRQKLGLSEVSWRETGRKIERWSPSRKKRKTNLEVYHTRQMNPFKYSPSGKVSATGWSSLLPS